MKCYVFVLMAVSLALASCGSSNNSNGGGPASSSVGGTVENLAGMGGGLQLQDNGTDTFLVNANRSFPFATPIARGSVYSMTVSTPPSSGHNEWTWMGGSNVINQKGIYGVKGTPSAANIPGARAYAVTWTDKSGNFWLFGGYGYDSMGVKGDLNDLWKYSGGEWTWTGGSNVVDRKGVYGAMGTPSAGNIPGARAYAVTWTDTTGNLWLFGGYGYDSRRIKGYLNDLWKYSGGEWTWENGSSLVDKPGVYGTQGTPAPGNVPGARQDAVSWKDASGNFWLFGGYGFGSTLGELNDLWRYSGGQWTWIGGSNVVNQKGVYGAMDTPSATNNPGARESAMAWTDKAGNFWLFGGAGYGSVGTEGDLNDLWKYNGGEWTWMGGSNVINKPGVYGTQGTASRTNIPGARWGAVTWTDKAGNFWLFGGSRNLSLARYDNGDLNDLWKYSGGEWTWVGGSNQGYQKGTFGTLDTPAPGDIPGARYGAVTWTDTAGDLWLFGGYGFYSAESLGGSLKDLWRYEP
jgi:hypothetical protein